MRGTSRNDTPKPGTFTSRRAPKDKKNDLVDSININNYSTKKTDREIAMEALARSKAIEAERKKKMVMVKLDDKTVVYTDKEKVDEMKQRYNERRL